MTPPPILRRIDSSRIRFHQPLHMRRRRITHYRLLKIDSGRGEFRFAGTSLEVHGGMLLLLAPGIRESRYRGDEEVSYLYVEFDADPDCGLFDGDFLSCPSTSPHFRTLGEMILSLHRVRGRGLDQLLPATVQLALFACRDGAEDMPADARIRRALQYIEQNLDRPLRVGELARTAGLSLPHFRRLFQRATGSGPKQFVLRERMKYARGILQTEGLRVGEVAELLRFDNVFHFSNQYKRVFGHSPVRDRSDAAG